MIVVKVGGGTSLNIDAVVADIVSLRAKGATDVGRLATRFGGGGHMYAAGYSTDLDAEAAVAALVAELTGSPARSLVR